MVSNRESSSMEEEQSTSPSPIKKKKKSSKNSSDRYPLRLRTPDLSNCHVCDSQINLKSKGKDKLRTLDSQWRIVIICNSCFNSLQSAQTCSYCFTQIHHHNNEELETSISCRFCNRRIHKDCLSMYGRLNSFNNNLDLDSDSFTCVDCWIPKSIHKISPGNNNNNGMDLSLLAPLSRVSEHPKAKDKENSSSVSFEDTMRISAVKDRKTVLGKAVVDIASVTANDELKLDSGVSPVLDDAELALRLHRAINSSPRTFRNLKSVKLDKSVYPRMTGMSGNSVSKGSDIENRITSEMEVGTDGSIPENADKDALESSPQIGTVEKKSFCKAGKQINCEMVLDASQVQMSDLRVCILALTEKKQQASFSSKAISRSFYKKTYSRSRCHQNRESVIESVEKCTGTGSLAELDVDISAFEKKSSRGSVMFLRKYTRRLPGGSRYIKKYSRRRQGGSKYIKMYSRRHKNPRSNLDQTSEWASATSCLKTESSGTAIPLLGLRNNEELTSNGTSAPSQASTSGGS